MALLYSRPTAGGPVQTYLRVAKKGTSKARGGEGFEADIFVYGYDMPYIKGVSRPSMPDKFIIPIDPDLPEYAQAYAFLKALPQFAGAEDI